MPTADDSVASGAAFDDDTFKSCISFNAEVVDHGARFNVFPRMRRQWSVRRPLLLVSLTSKRRPLLRTRSTMVQR